MGMQRGKAERHVYNNDVTPGYLFDDILQNYHPRNDRLSVTTEECPVQFRISIIKKKTLETMACQPVKCQWMKDFTENKPKDAIFVKGRKIREIKALELPIDPSLHTVTSVLYKGFAEMLIVSSQDLKEEWSEALEKYLLAILNGAHESFVPTELLKSASIVYIYYGFGNNRESRQNHLNKHTLQEFCRILKDTKVSTIPMSAYTEGPRPTLPNAEAALDETNYQVCDASAFPQAHTDSYHTHPLNDLTDTPVPLTRSKRLQGVTREGYGSMDGSGGRTSTQRINHIGQEMGTQGVSSSTGAETAPIHKSNTGSGSSGGSGGEQEQINVYVKPHNAAENFQMQAEHTDTGFSLSLAYNKPLDSHNNRNLGWVAPHMSRDDNDNPEFRNKKTLSLSTSVDFSQSMGGHKQSLREMNTITKACSNQQHMSAGTKDDKDITDEKECMMHDDSRDLPASQRAKEVTASGGTAVKRNYYEANENQISMAGTNDTLHSKYHGHNPGSLGCSQQSLQERTASDMCGAVKANTSKDTKRCSGDKNKSKDPSHSQNSMTQSVETVDVNKEKHSDGKETGKKKKKDREEKVHMKSSFLKPEKTTQEAYGIQRNFYGEINESYPEKVIIFLGASGSGKTTLINFIANYFMVKKSADDNIFHVESTSQTSAVTAYTFALEKDEMNITIIDTPGLNDSSGAEVRDHVQTLKTFIANATSNGMDIHAIGFVAQAHLVRLTSSERLVMDYVSKMFGQNVSEHLITLVTFADNQDTPPVIEAMNNYGVNFKLFLKFNNSSLSNNKSDEIDDLDRAYWRVCWKNWRKCVKTMKDMAPLSTNTMRAVQSEIYGKTVVKSAEKDLLGEMSCFLNLCKTQNQMSEAAVQACETIWELAAVVRRMNHKDSLRALTTEDIIIDFALKSCKSLGIQSEGIVNLLSLAPSGRLLTSGLEIIRTMAQFYDVAKKFHSKSDTLSRNITEWSYCQTCEKEHKMNRLKNKESSSWSFGKSPNIQVLSLQCKDCKCSGEMHGLSSAKSPFHPESVLKYTAEHLSKALEQYSLPGFTVPRLYFLMHLEKHLDRKHTEFIQNLIKIYGRTA